MGNLNENSILQLCVFARCIHRAYKKTCEKRSFVAFLLSLFQVFSRQTCTRAITTVPTLCPPHPLFLVSLSDTRICKVLLWRTRILPLRKPHSDLPTGARLAIHSGLPTGPLYKHITVKWSECMCVFECLHEFACHSTKASSDQCVHVHILVHISDQRVSDPLMQTEWHSVIA